MKTISAGILVLNEYREILLGHVTHQPFWDIFKGKVEQGESYALGALRELYEESGLEFKLEDLKDCGFYSLNKKKNLQLYKVEVLKADIALELLCCISYVEGLGVPFPEMDGYRWVSLEEANMLCYSSLARVLEELKGKALL